MKRRVAFSFVAAAALAATLCVSGASAAGKTSASLDGVWTNATATPMERPAQYGARLVLSEGEVAQIEKGRGSDEAADTTLFGTPGEISYRVMRVGGQPRTSLITSTLDGRIPPVRPGVAPAVNRATPVGKRTDNPETMSPVDRCLASIGNGAGPIQPTSVGLNNFQFVQTKGEVAILSEALHDVRHIRIGAKSHLPAAVRPWMGDSIGWWEGDTLVAETTNFNPELNFHGASAHLKLTERFTRTGPNSLLYRFTVEDPTVWAKPWGGEYEFRPAKGPIYELACHEGNFGLEGLMAGARQEEDAALEKISTRPAPPRR